MTILTRSGMDETCSQTDRGVMRDESPHHHPTDADWWGWSEWDEHRRGVVTATEEEVQPTVGADV